MRKGDKLKNIEQVNLMIEQCYLKSKGLLKEEEYTEGPHNYFPNDPKKPKSITIELVDDNFVKEDFTSLSKNDNSAIVSHNRNWFNLKEGELKLQDGYYYPIYKCITDLKRYRESKFTEGAYIMYLSYDKERNEVLISMSSEQASLDMIGSSSPESFESLSDDKNWYTKFVNGCRVGEVDNRGYFKIVEVK